MIALWLIVSLAQYSFQSCPEDFCLSIWRKTKMDESQVDAVLLAEDKSSGCTCREFPGMFSFCYSRATCLSFPKDVQIKTKELKVHATQIREIKTGDLAKMTHLETLKIEGNYNLTRILPGSFLNMSSLKNLFISENVKLEVLQKGCFDGLVNLKNLYLIKNAFKKVSDATIALSNLPKLLLLDIRGNIFTQIIETEFESLQNSSLEELNLDLCQIENIQPKALNPLKNLTVLRLGENSIISIANLSAMMKETVGKVPLKVLDLHSIDLKKSTSKELFKALAETNITSLKLSRNQIEIIDIHTFPEMPNIQDLDLSEMSILNITNNAFVNFPNLKSLLLKGNKLASIPDGVLLQRLTYLDLQLNSGNKFTSSYFSVYGSSKFINMKNLKTLNLSFNRIQALYNTSFLGLENLQILALKDATIYKIDNDSFSVFTNLKFLTLEKNMFLKSRPTILEEGLFDSLINLRVLLLGRCGIKYISHKANPFKNLKKLLHLGLDGNNLITPPNFEALANLRTIDLSHNNLQPWKNTLFNRNKYLIDVRVNDNKFSYLSPAMIEDFKNLSVLDLQNNPFICDCHLFWKTEDIIHLIENQTIICANSVNSLTLKKFIKDESQWHCQNWTLVIILSVVLFCVITILLILYYMRWHLRYWIFLTRLHLSRTGKIHRRREPKTYTNYIYDAFISYSNEDRNFVIRLVTMLENYPPYIRLCVYERDFEVGTIISENVLESIAKSRKTVLIISNSYAKSQWCRWESQIAEHHRLFFQNDDGEYVDDSLILIKLGLVNEVHMTPTLKYLMKTRIYLQWDEDENMQKIFWKKLREALAPPKDLVESTTYL